MIFSYQILVERCDINEEFVPEDEIHADEIIAVGGIFPIGKNIILSLSFSNFKFFIRNIEVFL